MNGGDGGRRDGCESVLMVVVVVSLFIKSFSRARGRDAGEGRLMVNCGCV